MYSMETNRNNTLFSFTSYYIFMYTDEYGVIHCFRFNYI